MVAADDRQSARLQKRFEAAVDGLFPAVAIKKFKQAIDNEPVDGQYLVGVMTGAFVTVKKTTRLHFQKLVIGIDDFQEHATRHLMRKGFPDSVRCIILADQYALSVEDATSLR